MIKNIFNTFFLRIFNAIVNLLLAVVISRYMGAEVKGEQGLMLTTISLLHIIMCIVGLGAIVYLIPRLTYTQLVIPSYVWAAVVSVFGYIILPFVQPEASKFYIDICLLTFLLTISNFNISSLVAREKIAMANRITFIQIVLLIGGLMLFVFVFHIRSVYAYVYALYLSYSVSLLVSYIPIYKEFTFSKSLISFNSIREGFVQLFRYGFFNQLDVFAQTLSFRFSYYVLANHVGTRDVGIYSVAVSIAESIWLISRSISMVHNARVANTLDFEKNAKLTMQFIKAGSLLTLCGLLVLIAFPSGLYTFVFGNDFSTVKQVILSIAPGILFFSASFMISGLFAGIGKQYINSIASIVGLVVTVAGAFLLIPHYGIFGAGITANISYLTTTIVKIYYFKKQAHLKWFDFVLNRADVSCISKKIVQELRSFVKKYH